MSNPYRVAGALILIQMLLGGFVLVQAGSTTGIRIAVVAILLLTIVGIVLGYARFRRLAVLVRMISSAIGSSWPEPGAGSGSIATLGVAINQMIVAFNQTNTRLQQVLDTVAEGVVAIDHWGNIELLNKAAENMFGCVTSQVIGKSIKVLVADQHLATYEHYLGELLSDQDKRIINVATHFQGKKSDGNNFPMKISVGRYELAGENHFIATVRDLTLEYETLAQKQLAEDALQASEDRYRSLIDQSTDLIWQLDATGHFTFLSPSLKALTGFEPEEIVGSSITDAFSGPDRAKVMGLLDAALHQGNYEDTVVELVHHRRDGSQFPGEAHCITLLNTNGEIIGLQGITRDITDRKSMEAELLKMEKLESVGVLAGGIAHDLNNFLTSLVGHLSLARLDTTQTEVNDNLVAAEHATDQIKNLTQQLLTFSKGGAPILRNANLSITLEQTVKFTLSGSNIKADLDLDKDLWTVRIDEGQINQVINNLIINAQQAMPDGGIVKVTAKNVTLPAKIDVALMPGKYVRFTIADCGKGIEKEYLKKIFDPFFTTKKHGSGLGLATSYSVIQKHEGLITVCSEPAAGTVFDVYLPAFPEDSPLAVVATDQRLVTGEGRILVMDDERSIRDVVTASLQKLGYEVETAECGNGAIECFTRNLNHQTPFDAVILDLTVPGGTGGSHAIERIKKIDPNVKSICASGYSNDPVMAQCSNYGFDLALAKPFRIRDLSKALGELLGNAA